MKRAIIYFLLATVYVFIVFIIGQTDTGFLAAIKMIAAYLIFNYLALRNEMRHDRRP